MTNFEKYQEDFEWQAKFEKQIRAILADALIRISSVEEDRTLNADFVMFNPGENPVASRVRSYNPMFPGYFEFTIRSDRPSGAETEYAKIMRGCGKWFVYAITKRDKIIVWKIIDLDKFRIWARRYEEEHDGKRPGTQFPNEDGSSDFLIFNDYDCSEVFFKKGKIEEVEVDTSASYDFLGV